MGANLTAAPGAQVVEYAPGLLFSQGRDLIRNKQLQVVEYALGLLPTREVRVATPTAAEYSGRRVSASVCGVSVIRSGEAMEAALRSCWKGIDVGKILVERRHPPGRGAARAPPAADAAVSTGAPRSACSRSRAVAVPRPGADEVGTGNL